MSKDIKTIALFGNDGQEKAAEAARSLYSVAHQYGIEVFTPTTDTFDADLVVCLGGDGTFLDVAGKVGKKEISIVGINTGHLGFLANCSTDEIDEVIRDIHTGNYHIVNHSVLQVRCEGHVLPVSPFALNEVAILKHDVSSMISINTTIDREYLTTYMADGLIIGTPTGSTAYSLSVGGPIIAPQLDTICLTPVAPHSLNMRPIVVSDKSEIQVTINSRSQSFLLSLDGRCTSLPDNMSLTISKAPYHVRVVNRNSDSFFSTLRKKMMWGQDSRN